MSMYASDNTRLEQPKMKHSQNGGFAVHETLRRGTQYMPLDREFLNPVIKNLTRFGRIREKNFIIHM